MDSAWGLGGNGEGVDGMDTDLEVVMIIGVLMTLNGKQCHIHSARTASYSSKRCVHQSS